MSRLSCGVEWIRLIFVVLNIIFFLIGCSILGLGIYNIIQASGEETMQWIGKIMISIGTLIMCLAVFGCFGAIYHNRILLYTYLIVLSIIIISELTNVIVTLRFHNDLWESYDRSFKNVFQRAYQNNRTDIIKIISKIEQEFECCGVDNLADYVKSGYQIPLSCYSNQTTQERYFNQGCAEAIVIRIWNELPTIVAIVGTILSIELFAVISSLVLSVAIVHVTNTDVYYKL